MQQKLELKRTVLIIGKQVIDSRGEGLGFDDDHPYQATSMAQVRQVADMPHQITRVM